MTCIIVSRTQSVGFDAPSSSSTSTSASNTGATTRDRAPIPPQNLTVEITPESFVREIAFARTFVLDSEVAALQAAGYGRRMTHQDLLVFDANGLVIDNELRAPDEAVRHKILDCLGDFALIGTDLRGYFNA